MIQTYCINVTQFENETLFRERVEGLSLYRQQKIAKLKHVKDQYRSLGAGLALDYALKTYGLAERSVEYEMGEWGKPFLKGQPDIHFSLSHSGEYAICSIGSCPLGNDIERIQKGRIKVAERFFAPEELDFLRAAQDEMEMTQRMFRIWTRKESFLKAIGRGISFPMGEFSTIDAGQRGNCVRHTYDDTHYFLQEYREIPGYCTAVCYQEGKEAADRMQVIS